MLDGRVSRLEESKNHDKKNSKEVGDPAHAALVPVPLARGAHEHVDRARSTQREPHRVAERALGNGLVEVALVTEHDERHTP